MKAIKKILNLTINNCNSSFRLLSSPIGLLVIFCVIMLANNACKDALGLDPNIKKELLKTNENVVRDTVFLYPGSMNDSTYVVIIRYQNEKDSLQRIVDSLRKFYYPKLNPSVINIDSNIFSQTIFYTNANGFEQKKVFNWQFNSDLLNIRLDTLENWPVATLNYNLNELAQKNESGIIEYRVKSFKINTDKLGLLQSRELKIEELDKFNNYEIIIEDNNGNIYKNPEFIGKVRVWFSDMNINRLDAKIVRHSFVINMEVIIAGMKTKTVFRGSTYVNYY